MPGLESQTTMVSEAIHIPGPSYPDRTILCPDSIRNSAAIGPPTSLFLNNIDLQKQTITNSHRTYLPRCSWFNYFIGTIASSPSLRVFRLTATWFIIAFYFSSGLTSLAEILDRDHHPTPNLTQSTPTGDIND